MIDIAKAREALDNIGLNFTVFHLLQSRDIKTLSDFINEVEAALKAEPVMVYDGEKEVGRGGTVRAALDAAMKEPK